MAVSKVDLGVVGTAEEPVKPLDFYPVGSIYLSFNNTSPASIFGGSWTQITGRFLRAANDVSTGGSDTVTLTTAQMPNHSHGANIDYYVNGGWATRYNDYWIPSSGVSSYGVNTPFTCSYLGGAGETKSHSVMPAYQNVYAWRRTV